MKRQEFFFAALKLKNREGKKNRRESPPITECRSGARNCDRACTQKLSGNGSRESAHAYCVEGADSEPCDGG